MSKKKKKKRKPQNKDAYIKNIVIDIYDDKTVFRGMTKGGNLISPLVFPAIQGTDDEIIDRILKAYPQARRAKIWRI